MKALFRATLSYILSFQFWLQRRLFVATRSSIRVGDPVSAAEHDNLAERYNDKLTEWLRKRVVRYPYWFDGHLALGALLLKQGDTVTAYGASQSAIALSKGSPARLAEAKRLLVECYLGNGEPQLAESAIRDLEQLIPLDATDRENLAAALMGQSRLQEAQAILAELPSSSSGGRASGAFEYLARQEKPSD